MSKEKIKIKLNETTMKILTNFFVMNKNGEFVFSEEKQKKFLKKIEKKVID